MTKTLSVKLVRSPIGYEKSQKATVRALGLTKMHQVVEQAGYARHPGHDQQSHPFGRSDRGVINAQSFVRRVLRPKGYRHRTN